MKVDISPKRPPISSWTAAAPSGSGSDGGGSSTPSRSMRWIMQASLPSGTASVPATRWAQPLRRARRNRDAAERPDGIAQRYATRPQHLAPQAEADVALAAQRRERREHRRVGRAALRVARGDGAARHRLQAAQQRAAGLDLAPAPAVLLPSRHAADRDRHAEAARVGPGAAESGG